MRSDHLCAHTGCSGGGGGGVRYFGPIRPEILGHQPIGPAGTLVIAGELDRAQGSTGPTDTTAAGTSYEQDCNREQWQVRQQLVDTENQQEVRFLLSRIKQKNVI